MATILSVDLENVELDLDEDLGTALLEIRTIDKAGQRHLLQFEGPALELLVKAVPAFASKVLALRRH